jgi:hypothetical protein
MFTLRFSLRKASFVFDSSFHLKYQDRFGCLQTLFDPIMGIWPVVTEDHSLNYEYMQQID